jgi:hypothetical protein
MTDELSLDRLNQVSGGMSLSDQIAAINSQKALAAAKYNHAMDAAYNRLVIGTGGLAAIFRRFR